MAIPSAFDGLKAGILQLLYHFPVHVCYRMRLYQLKIE